MHRNRRFYHASFGARGTMDPEMRKHREKVFTEYLVFFHAAFVTRETWGSVKDVSQIQF